MRELHRLPSLIKEAVPFDSIKSRFSLDQEICMWRMNRCQAIVSSVYHRRYRDDA